MSDITVSNQWDAISKDEQEKITNGLRSCGSLKPGDNIVSGSTKSFDPDSPISIQWDPIGDICRIGCDTAAGTALVWCDANTAGLGLIACVAAAEAIRQSCRNGC
jgi:hypothetical protein